MAPWAGVLHALEPVRVIRHSPMMAKLKVEKKVALSYLLQVSVTTFWWQFGQRTFSGSTTSNDVGSHPSSSALCFLVRLLERPPLLKSALGEAVPLLVVMVAPVALPPGRPSTAAWGASASAPALDARQLLAAVTERDVGRLLLLALFVAGVSLPQREPGHHIACHSLPQPVRAHQDGDAAQLDERGRARRSWTGTPSSSSSCSCL